MAGRKVVIAGASGLVGSSILKQLEGDLSVDEIHVLSRRPLSYTNSKLINHVVDFKSIPTLPEVDEVYLALGTTIKQAGSQVAFSEVDFMANLSVAKAGIAAGAKYLGVVSAMNANSASTIFYNRVKGELEDALSALELESLIIARPSLILGNRDKLNQPIRIGEKVGVWLSKIFKPIIPINYQAVEAKKIAAALVSEVPHPQGRLVLLSGDIQRY